MYFVIFGRRFICVGLSGVPVSTKSSVFALMLGENRETNKTISWPLPSPL
jgi:hypothetical protein